MTLRIHPDEIVETSPSQLVAIHPSWARVRLGQVADVLNGFAFRSAAFSLDKGTPLLRIRDVGRASTSTRYVGEFDHRYVVRRGDVVVGMDGDFRVARWTGPDALLNQRVCKITVHSPELYDPSFLLFALPGYLDAINGQTSSITVKHLSSRTVQEIPLPLPPLNEQRRIVAAIEEQFSRLDAADESLRQAERRLTTLRASLLASATVGYKPVELGRVVSDLRYGTSIKCAYDGPGVPVIRIPNVARGQVDLTDLKFATDASADLSSFVVMEGDLLFVRTNGSRDLIGRVAAVHGVGATVFASYLIRARPDRAKLDPGYAVLALSTPAARASIEARAATTAGQYNLNLQGLRSLPIPLPTFVEQQKIVARVHHGLSLNDALHDVIEATCVRSAALRRSILEQAFRGELVPQDPDDEPASVLLERIAAERATAEPARGHRPRPRATMQKS